MSVAVQLKPRRMPSPHLGALAFSTGARSHAGRVRQHNEDAWLDRSGDGLWAVADGMGGHEAGDVASREVVRALAGVSDVSSAFAFRRDVRNALFVSNTALRRPAVKGRSVIVGSTVVVLMAHGGHYACTWAGDSRAYLLRKTVLTRITTDHSLAQELVSKGVVSEAEVRSIPNANVITRAVGASATLELDGVYGSIHPGDRFLLCSDGLFTTVSDAEIAAVLDVGSADDAAAHLLDRALAAGAPDNVTCIVIDAQTAV